MLIYAYWGIERHHTKKHKRNEDKRTMEKTGKQLLESIQAGISALVGELDRIDDELKKKRDTKTRSLLLNHVAKLDELELRFSELAHDIEPFISEAKTKTKQDSSHENAGTRSGTYQKTPRGEKTPQHEYIIPILLVLQKHGGRADCQVVIEQVGTLMEHRFSDVDKQALESEPHEIRWRNTVRWTRNEMVQNLGLLKRDSPHGIWEITDDGRRYLIDAEFRGQMLAMEVNCAGLANTAATVY